MPQEFRLQKVLELAESQTQTAAANLGALHRQLEQHEEKLRLLFKYRDEYQERLRRATTDGVDGPKLRNYHDFMQRLENAIMQQHAVIVDAHARVEGGRREWQYKQRKSKAFDTLSQRFVDATRRHDATRDQKVQDAFASRHATAKLQSRR